MANQRPRLEGSPALDPSIFCIVSSFCPSFTPSLVPFFAGKEMAFLAGWWLGHPSEKYERQLG